MKKLTLVGGPVKVEFTEPWDTDYMIVARQDRAVIDVGAS
jgi:hypothetical protein